MNNIIPMLRCYFVAFLSNLKEGQEYPIFFSGVVLTCRNLLGHYGKDLGLDFRNVPENPAGNQFAGSLAKAWSEYNDSR